MDNKLNYNNLLKKYIEPPITSEEKDKSKTIRNYLKNNKFDELYEIIPKDIAKLINSKYRVFEPILKA